MGMDKDPSRGDGNPIDNGDSNIRAALDSDLISLCDSPARRDELLPHRI